MSLGVVVAARGWAPYLAETLDAVLAERPDRVVLVDDGSDDPIALHPDHVAHVELVRRETPGGPGAARNTGVEALGDVDLIAFCDADDAWEPGSLALRVKALAAAEWASAAFGRARIVGPDGRETGESWDLPPAGRFDDAARLYDANPILTSSVVVRRSVFACFDESYSQAEDWELWLRMARDGRAFLCVPEAVVRYRRHAGGLTTRLTELARAQARMHAQHAEAVSPDRRAAAEARDRAGEAEGLVREGRFTEARTLMAPGRRRALVGLPVARRLVGRRDPYRRG